MRWRTAIPRSCLAALGAGLAWSSLASAAVSAAPQRGVAAVVQRPRRHRVGPRAVQARPVPRAPLPARRRRPRRRATSSTTATPACASPARARGSTRSSPTVIEYLPGTGIVHTQRAVSSFTSTSTTSRPWPSPRSRASCSSKVTQTGGAGPIDVYSIFNYHLGTGSPSPGPTPSRSSYDATRDAFYEWGPSGATMAYAQPGAVELPRVHPQQPVRPAQRRLEPRDDPGTGGPTTDAVAGFQRSLGSLASGASDVGGLGDGARRPAATAPAAVEPSARGSTAARPPSCSPTRSPAGTRGSPPRPAARARPRPRSRSSRRSILRMGQVQETGQRAAGQILASVAPGQWNISWVRDMAYADRRASSRAATRPRPRRPSPSRSAQQSGTLPVRTSGAPYQISVCRYYGNGSEWSDSNADGPNIEFDGFGLFLWELDEYVKASGDTASLDHVVAHGQGARWATCSWVCRSRRAHRGRLVDLGGALGRAAEALRVHDHHRGERAVLRVAPRHGRGRQHELARSTSRPGRSRATRCCRTCAPPTGRSGRAPRRSRRARGWLDAAVMEAIDFGLVDPPAAPRARPWPPSRRARAGERPRLHAERRGRRLLLQRVGVHRPARRARPRAPGQHQLPDEPVRVERRAGGRQLRRAVRAARSDDRRTTPGRRPWSASARAHTSCRSTTAARRSRPPAARSLPSPPSSPMRAPTARPPATPAATRAMAEPRAATAASPPTRARRSTRALPRKTTAAPRRGRRWHGPLEGVRQRRVRLPRGAATPAAPRLRRARTPSGPCPSKEAAVSAVASSLHREAPVRRSSRLDPQ